MATILKVILCFLIVATQANERSHPTLQDAITTVYGRTTPEQRKYQQVIFDFVVIKTITINRKYDIGLTNVLSDQMIRTPIASMIYSTLIISGLDFILTVKNDQVDYFLINDL